MPIAALIGAAASLGNALYQNEANENSWIRQNEYNSPVNQMARYQQAGLNPNLIYGNGTSSAGNADSPPNAVGVDPTYLGLIQQSLALKQQEDHFQQQMDLARQKLIEQQRVNSANISATQARTAGILLDNDFKRSSNPFKIDLAKWQANASRYNALKSQFQFDYMLPLQRDLLQFSLDRKNWEREHLWDLEKDSLFKRNNILSIDYDTRKYKFHNILPNEKKMSDFYSSDEWLDLEKRMKTALTGMKEGELKKLEDDLERLEMFGTDGSDFGPLSGLARLIQAIIRYFSK